MKGHYLEREGDMKEEINIGIGDNGQESLLPQYAQWIEESEVLVGGERHLAFFRIITEKRSLLKVAYKRLWTTYKRRTRKLC